MATRAKAARLVAIGGGKGGVGKSVIAANLSVALADAGARAVLVDADLGGANQHTLFGLATPGGGLQSFLAREVDSLEAALVPTDKRGLRLLPGTGAVMGAANIPHAQKLRLLRHLRQLDADVVVVDVGAGVAFNTLDLFEVGDFRLVVMTPQLTSMQNAYAFLKGAVLRTLRRLATTDEETAAFDADLGKRDSERVADALRHLGDRFPRLGEAMRRELGAFGAFLIGNLVENPHDVAIFGNVSRMIESFLGIAAPVLAVLPHSRTLHESVNRRRPLALEHPEHPVSRGLARLAETLLLAPLARAAEAEAQPTGDEERPATPPEGIIAARV